MSEEFVKDRAELFSVFSHLSYKELRPSASAEFL
jgi:hypothetical protein